ncbi:diaminopimelate decarboxylase [Humibacillus xanthopallidus]|uniref:Diaminopimelate decarboxylase n=1 Tax=Humibacillus xanthopallidus TaxID=412689 RepID=A0A543HVJ5_9MICO|nr:diaminopimelate decarboxylase [Humibacillus xanthopallidus]TQM62383.1 diaminopimelate decarboxylase [Humibacillus xanthopallidus]
MHAHEAGALHAEGYRGPSWLRTPVDVNALVPSLWATSVGRGGDGVLTVGGVSVTELAREFGTPAYVIDEDDFRSRARDFKQTYAEVFGSLSGADVFYAGKAFLCTEVARWIHDEGLHLDVCTGGELAVAIRAGVPGERIGLHGNNKSVAEIRAALDHGVSRIVIDSFDEIERVSAVASELGVVAPVLIRVTVGVEAHTHEFIATAHEDQKFGLSLSGGHAFDAARRILERPDALRLLGLHSHIGSQIFDTSGFEVSARRILGLHTQIARELGTELPELDLGGGFGIAYTTEHDPLPPKSLAAGMAEIIERECRADGVTVPRISIEPGRAIAGPSTFTLYEVGTVKPVDLDGGASRVYVSVDGGMSDNVRTALYDANYSCTLASRTSLATPALARVVGRHCESGDIVVKDEFLPADVTAGDLIAVPGTGAYCRSLSSQYNHTPRPPVVAVRDGRARVIVRRETIDDLLALDV